MKSFVSKFLLIPLFLSISLYIFQISAIGRINSELEIPSYGSLKNSCGEANLLIRFCNSGREVLLLGDSHAEMYALALSNLYRTKDIPFADASLTSCPFLEDLGPKTTYECRNRNALVNLEIKKFSFKTLIYTQKFDNETDVLRTLKSLKKYSQYFDQIYLIGPNPVWPDGDKFLKIGPFFRPIYDPPKTLPIDYFSGVFFLESELIVKLSEIDNLSYLSPNQVFCSKVECRRSNTEGSWMYIDDNHLSIIGASELVNYWGHTLALRN